MIQAECSARDERSEEVAEKIINFIEILVMRKETDSKFIRMIVRESS